MLSKEQREDFEQNGYLIVENVLDKVAVKKIRLTAEKDAQLAENVQINKNYEEEGIGTKLVYRDRLGDDTYSAYVRSRQLIEPMEDLFSEKMRHYYHIQMLKDPNTGGWQWHQDYGYHYKEFFYPKFVSLMLALDPCTKDNGCLRVLRGSHHIGRLEHQECGSQLMADPERIEWATRELEEVHCELSPGSVLYFHGNILHASDPNQSSLPRWSIVAAYVTASNTCVLPEVEEKLSPVLDPWDDKKIATITQNNLSD